MKKLIMIFLICSVLLIALAVTASAETYGYYTYEISNGKATITDVSSGTSGDVVIPSTLGGYPVTTIGEYAFFDCYSLTSIVIPDSVTTIGEYAFSYCHSLTSVVIPDSVATIGEYAFYYCYRLTSVVIGDSVTAIGNAAFHSCYSLTSVVIGNSVTAIGSYAFAHCRCLTSVVIPDSVTTIGNFAFSSCEDLTSVVIPDSVTTMNGSVFSYCENLCDIIISENNTNFCIDDGVMFSKDKKTLVYIHAKRNATSYTIPYGVTTIGDGAFSWCESLTSVVIPDSVTAIGDYAFARCYSLTSVVIPDSVTTIGDRAFYSCKGLTSVVIGDSVTTIGDYAFEDCDGLTSVEIPDSVTTIGDRAFAGCNNLKYIYYNGDKDTFFGKINIGSKNDKLSYAELISGKFTLMYAIDGRCEFVEESRIQTQKSVGWYTAKPVLMYALDGRTMYVSGDEVEAYKKVGWFTSKTVLMQSADGRTIYVEEKDVKAYQNVGWFKNPQKIVYFYDGGGELASYNEMVVEYENASGYLYSGWESYYSSAELLYKTYAKTIDLGFFHNDMVKVYKTIEKGIKELEGTDYLDDMYILKTNTMDRVRNTSGCMLAFLNAKHEMVNNTLELKFNIWNVSYKEVTGFKFNIEAYDMYGNCINQFTNLTCYNATITPGKAAAYEWKQSDMTTMVSSIKNFTITEVIFEDGSKWVRQ